jgi:hypothetical protein
MEQLVVYATIAHALTVLSKDMLYRVYVVFRNVHGKDPFCLVLYHDTMQRRPVSP